LSASRTDAALPEPRQLIVFSALEEPVPFNHGVEGSSPSALTNEKGRFSNFSLSPPSACVCTVSANALRRILALPIYTLALILSFASDGLGILAAWIAGDE
jgi:hypothetical protein